MKQRIRVVGLVDKGDGVLLVKKAQGRLVQEQSTWELPAGKINFGEQPEEAMVRILYENIGVNAESVKLKDVVTFVDLEGASQLGNLYIIYAVKLEEKQKISLGERYSAYKFIKGQEQESSIKINESSMTILGLEEQHSTYRSREYRESVNGATVYIDGCSRGNPGPSGVGYHIVDAMGRVIKNGGEFVGFATSRVAEYYAMREGCQQAINLGLKNVRFVSDNLMMVNQLNGVYKVKNSDLLPMYLDIKDLLKNFEACAFMYVKREQNAEADMLANRAVDRHFDIDMVE